MSASAFGESPPIPQETTRLQVADGYIQAVPWMKTLPYYHETVEAIPLTPEPPTVRMRRAGPLRRRPLNIR